MGPVDAVHDQASAYTGEQDRPLKSFVGLMGLYAALTAGLGAAVLRRGEDQLTARDLALLGVATAKMSRVLARDRVTSPLRAPVTRFEDFSGASEVDESPRGTGLRLALGELVTCPTCLSQWVGTALLGGLLLRPHETRLLTSLFTVLAINDAVQAALAKLAEAEG